MDNCRVLISNLLLVILSLCCCMIVVADDTDIFLGDGSSAVGAPNVLFIIDNSGSMIKNPARDAAGNEIAATRWELLVAGLKDILTSSVSTGINVGFMRLADQGAIEYPVVPLNATTLPILNSVVDKMLPWEKQQTRIVGAFFEAQRYFAGKAVSGGLSRNGKVWKGESVWRVSHPDSYNTGASHVLPAGCSVSDFQNIACKDETIAPIPTPLYKSPITSDCQSNHIILLSDGKPSGTVSSLEADIEALIGKQCNGDAPLFPDELCGRSLVEWMASNPANPSFSNSKIFIHTIAYNLFNGDTDEEGAIPFLMDLANLGKGNFYSTYTQSDVKEAILKTLNDIKLIDKPATFTAASVSVNQFNRLAHRNELYFSMFKPSLEPRWAGNLKRYQLGGSPLAIQDQSATNAVDPTTGFFKDTSKSFWSTGTDGDKVELGGAASKLPTPAARKLVTYLAGAPFPSNDLTNMVNSIDPSNTAITSSALLAADATERTQLLNWIRGVDVLDENKNGSTSDARQHLGDPLHSAPVTVTYGGTEANPDISIFVGTNEGFLHAIDAADGKERFAFMPETLLKNIKPQMDNISAQPHIFGMDGSPVVWRHDDNSDQQIKVVDNDFVYVYAGMRRGGRNYYALDVSDRNKPQLLWQIKGGSGDFQNLGQTWSTPIKTRVKIGAAITDVLLFAGGYDPVVDANPTNRVNATMGNAIYMVDAKTGARLWMAGNTVANADGLKLPAMKYAIPSNLEVVDSNLDGLADTIFVGDLGGQIWRFDIQHGSTAASTRVKGGMVASLAADGIGPNNRRFFFKPDISFVANNGSIQMVLAMGSGSLVEPLSSVTQDRFYVFQVPGGSNAPDYATLTPLTEAGFIDRTDTVSGPVASTSWFIRMDGAGEKVLAPSLTINQKVIFTTYIPAPVAACSLTQGKARYFVMNLINGNPVRDMDADGDIDKLDRSQFLATTVIASQPQVLFGEGGEAAATAGPNILGVDLGIDDKLRRSYWYKQPTP